MSVSNELTPLIVLARSQIPFYPLYIGFIASLVVAGVTLQLLQFKIHFGMGCAMGKWNCYTVTVTQGVSNLNDRFGVNGTVATVAVARGVPNSVEESF